MVLYLISCGNQNNQNKCIGQTNIPLDEQSKNEIIKLRETIINKKQEVIIYTSDLQTAQESCSLFCNNIITKIEYNIEPLLRDINFGKWERLKWDDIYEKYSEDLANFSKDWINNKATSGESFLDVINRVKSFIITVQEKVINKNKVFVFNHPSTIRAILCNILELPLDRAYSFKINYGSVYKLDYDTCNKGWILMYCNLPFIM